MEKGFGLLLVLTIIGLTGCSQYFANQSSLSKAYDTYKEYDGYKAMAVATGSDGRHAIGYSYDCTSEASAKRIAINKCKNTNNKETKVDAECKIYAIENQIIK